MKKPAHQGLRVPGTLLALAFLLQGFTISNAKDPATVTGIPKAAPPSLVVAKPLGNGFTITGPSSVSRYGSATFSISNGSGQCITWYYNGSYTNSSNGPVTLYFDQWTVGERTVTASNTGKHRTIAVLSRGFGTRPDHRLHPYKFKLHRATAGQDCNHEL